MVAIAAFVFVLGAVLALATLGSPFSTAGKSKAAASRLIGFAGTATGTPGDGDNDSTGDGGVGGGGGGGDGSASPRPHHVEAVAILAQCAQGEVEKIVNGIKPGPGGQIERIKVDPIKIGNGAASCAQSEFDKRPHLKAWGDGAGAARDFFSCIADVSGLKSALDPASGKSQTAGRSFLNIALSALTLIGNESCHAIARDLKLYQKGNLFVAFVQKGAQCTVATISTGVKAFEAAVDLAGSSEQQILDAIAAALSQQQNKKIDAAKDLAGLKEKVDEFVAKCREARRAAGAIARDIADGMNYVMQGAPIDMGWRRFFVFPSLNELMQRMRYAMGLEPEPLRYAAQPVQLGTGSIRDYFTRPHPQQPDTVVITGPGGSVSVTRDNPRFSIAGISGRVNFAEGALAIVLDLGNGDHQTFRLDVQGRIERTTNADGSVTYQSVLERNGVGWRVSTVAIGDSIRQTLTQADGGGVTLVNVNGRLVEIRYRDGTVETPSYDADGRLAGSRIVYPNGDVLYARTGPDGKLAVETAILPDGTIVKLAPTYDANGNRTGGIVRSARGETIIVDNQYNVITQFTSKPFVSGGRFVGEVRCDLNRDCYTVNAAGQPVLSIDKDGHVNRGDKFVDQFGRERPIEDFDPRKGDVITRVIPRPTSGYGADQRVIPQQTADTIEQQMRSLYGLNMYQPGGELGTSYAFGTCSANACTNNPGVSVSCYGQLVPVGSAATTCGQLAQQAAQAAMQTRVAFSFAWPDVPRAMEAGGRYRVKVRVTDDSGPNAPRGNDVLVAVERAFAPVSMPRIERAGRVIEHVFDVVAPSTPGRYKFDWRYVRNGEQSLASIGFPLEIDVVAPVDGLVTVVDAMTYQQPLSPGGFGGLFGANLAIETMVAEPATGCADALGSRLVDVFTADGATFYAACMSYVSPAQINIRLPGDIPEGNYFAVVYEAEGERAVATRSFWVGR